MYSLMSMRTIAFSSSNRNSASARASSVLPTPVGPRKMNEPIGPVRVLQAAAGAAHGIGHRGNRVFLADDALPQPFFHVDSFSRSPSSKRETGIPVQAATTSAMSLSVTSSVSSFAGRLVSRASFCPSPASFFSNSGRRPYWISLALLRSPSRFACSSFVLATVRSGR